MASTAERPNWLLTLTEGRSLLELGSFGLLRNSLRRLPRGDGHAVLVLPGFLASDRSTAPMRALLNDLGYDARGWDMGRNLKINPEREQRMFERLDAAFQESGGPVSLVGWSLGGIFARELAKRAPEKTRFVITLGSPISLAKSQARSRRLFEAVNGEFAADDLEDRFGDLEDAPEAPTTSIFTRGDGIVAWRGSVQRPGPFAENICLPSSHTGLGVNPLAMVAIADRLAQDEGAWAPFDMSGWRSAFFTSAPMLAKE
ncbi:MAG: alpha/beta hydrolase [Pseudomonadota bacterium]